MQIEELDRAIAVISFDLMLCVEDDRREALNVALSALRECKEQSENPGKVSDGYHTFNELYHHRAMLFSVICCAHPEIAWKSEHHDDGSMYDGMFICGIETPDGQATYHCEIEYWDMFEVPELDNAPKWDGHTPAQAIERIAALREYRERAAKPVIAYTESDMEFVHYKCPKCETILQQHFKRSRDPFTYSQKFCHECGQALIWQQPEGSAK